MNIYLFLTLISTTTASPLLPIDSVSNDEPVVSSNDEAGLGGQTQSPISGISTSQDTGPPIIDSWLDTAQVEPSLPFSSSDIAGFRFELTQNSPAAEKVSPVGERTTDAIYLCCESKGENKFLCDDSER